MKKLYKANIVFTPTLDAFECIENGIVAVNEDGTIEGVYKEIPSDKKDWPIEDFGNKLMIPGVYDLHVHAPQYRNQGMAMDLELLPWLEKYTFPEEMKYENIEYAKIMYSHFVKDMLKEGTLRASVFATSHPKATLELARLFDEAGMGAYVGLVGMDRNCPKELCRDYFGTGIYNAYLHDLTKDMPLVSFIITPRFIPTCSAELLKTLGGIAQLYNLPVQSHLSENKKEIAWVKRLQPRATCYGDAYRRYGLFGQTPTLMAHCIYSDEKEIKLMKQGNVYVVHCPTSNCNVASGIAPIRRYLNEGIPVALGSDISGGHHLSIFRVMQYAQQMSKLKYAETNGKLKFLTLSEVFYLGTKSGGSFFGKVGSFEPGYEFDALVIDDAPLNVANEEAGCEPYTLEERLERFIYLGDNSLIEQRYVRGKQLSV